MCPRPLLHDEQVAFTPSGGAVHAMICLLMRIKGAGGNGFRGEGVGYLPPHGCHVGPKASIVALLAVLSLDYRLQHVTYAANKPYIYA